MPGRKCSWFNLVVLHESQTTLNLPFRCLDCSLYIIYQEVFISYQEYDGGDSKARQGDQQVRLVVWVLIHLVLNNLILISATNPLSSHEWIYCPPSRRGTWWWPQAALLRHRLSLEEGGTVAEHCIGKCLQKVVVLVVLLVVVLVVVSDLSDQDWSGKWWAG